MSIRAVSRHGKTSILVKQAALAAVLLFLVISTGCTIELSFGTDTDFDLLGEVVLEPYDLLIDTGEVQLTGPVNRYTTLKYDGTFSFVDLPAGEYTVDVTTPLGDQAGSVNIDRNKTVQVTIDRPSDINYPTFLEIGGIWNVMADSNTYTISRGKGYNMRWANGSYIPVYIGPGPAAAGATWSNTVWDYIKTFPVDFYDNRVIAGRVYSSAAAKIQLTTVATGYLGEGLVGIARIDDVDDNGYLRKVIIMVDEFFYNINNWPVIGHELMHAIGAAHVSTEYSLMYPFLETGANNGLTAAEATQLQYALCLAPGQGLNSWVQPGDTTPSAPVGIMATTEKGGGLYTTTTDAEGHSIKQAGIPENLKQLPEVQAFLKQDAGSDMLWDMVNVN